MSMQPLPSGHLPEPPDGWQYAVVMGNGRVWGCGAGKDGKVRQRMRLRYRTTLGPCLVPLRWDQK